jgi:hypothetical protein
MAKIIQLKKCPGSTVSRDKDSNSLLQHSGRKKRKQKV